MVGQKYQDFLCQLMLCYGNLQRRLRQGRRVEYADQMRKRRCVVEQKPVEATDEVHVDGTCPAAPLPARSSSAPSTPKYSYR